MPDATPLNLGLPKDLEPKFVNVVRIAHTPGEFVLDFASILPGISDPQVDLRIVLSPLGAKMMQQAVNENIRRYESTFGEIRPALGHTLAEDLFNNPGNPTSPKEGA